MDELHGGHGLVLEELVPGLVLTAEGLLILQTLVGVDEQGGQLAVLGHKALVGVAVVVGGVGGGVVLPVDGQCGAVALQDAGVVHQQEHGQDHKADGQKGVQNGGPLVRGPLLRLVGGSGINAAVGHKFLPLFLFSGCAHEFFIPSKKCPPPPPE